MDKNLTHNLVYYSVKDRIPDEFEIVISDKGKAVFNVRDNDDINNVKHWIEIQTDGLFSEHVLTSVEYWAYMPKLKDGEEK